MEISKGMYIRFKDNKGIQYIGKLININEYREPCFKYAIEVNWYDDYIFIGDDDILKVSFNIIDLIEVGDYVNGYLVIGKPYKFYDTQFISLDTSESWNWSKGEMPIKYIETIITKEQFNSMKYVVERK